MDKDLKMSKWFENQRAAFIAEVLHVYGFINREHLTRKFDISVPQASKDLQSYMRRTSSRMCYNASTKRYERTDS